MANWRPVWNKVTEFRVWSHWRENDSIFKTWTAILAITKWFPVYKFPASFNDFFSRVHEFMDAIVELVLVRWRAHLEGNKCVLSIITSRRFLRCGVSLSKLAYRLWRDDEGVLYLVKGRRFFKLFYFYLPMGLPNYSRLSANFNIIKTNLSILILGGY